jgi:hypothetical protein
MKTIFRIILRDLPRVGGMALALLLLCPFAYAASARCETKVEMADYSLCVPQGWNIQRNVRDDSIEVCNRAERRRCASDPFGYPYPGAVVMNIIPSDRGYGIYQTPEELTRRARVTGQPPPVISDVRIEPHDGVAASKCWVARTLMPGAVWSDTYSLSVGGRRFRVSVLYNNEPANAEEFRASSLRLLSSVEPLSGGRVPGR